MGVPSFYLWLVKKYPNTVMNAIEESGIDCSLPNPNGMEFDNLYLDMNGIIHPCFHPEDSLFPPTTFVEVYKNIFDYVDRLFRIVRPRKLLYMAIDGVAPRAKMNQQRSRRFRTAQDNEIAEAEEDRLRREFEMEGKEVLPKLESELSDSNIITPGTEFMYALSKVLQNYICRRLSSDQGWKDIKVILSDANVPGEGEHKIMSFIRLQRNLPGYDPNTRHCLYGLDADLIMLALATHEVHFSILREDVIRQEKQPICTPALESTVSRQEFGFVKSRAWFDKVQKINEAASLAKKPYQFFSVWILRQYLELDLRIVDPPFEIDFERIIDDFIFICFFSGNDFLPHMPTLEIHEGAIDLLMTVYKEEFKRLGGYLVDMQRAKDSKAAYIKLKRVEKFILAVGTYEDRIFKKRSELQERKIKRVMRECLDADGAKEWEIVKNSDQDGLGLNTGSGFCKLSNALASTLSISDTGLTEIHSSSSGIDSSKGSSDVLRNTKELRKKLKDVLREKSDLFKQGSLERDKIKLGTVGWKERFYKEKFSAEGPKDIESIRKEIVTRYTEGLCWVLQYYFSGVPSWTWFYPYHYGPFASDLKGLTQVHIRFVRGFPFKPLDQLMGVLPRRSGHALPKAYWELMTSEESNIADFYPTDFEVDTYGKRFAWQGIAKLNFIVEERLLQETKKLEKDLREDEMRRNSETKDKLFVRKSNTLASKVLAVYSKQSSAKEKIKEPIDTDASGGMNGFIQICDGDLDVINSICHVNDPVNIQEDDVIAALYELPDTHLHVPRPPEGVQFPDKTITDEDIVNNPLWHECEGHQLPRSNYSQIHERSRKEFNGAKYSSANSSSPTETWKVAGSGWGVGRGKGFHETSTKETWRDAGSAWGAGRGKGYLEHSERMTANNGINSISSSSALGRGESKGPGATRGDWKVVGSSSGDWRANRPMEVSKPNQHFKSNETAQVGNNSSWRLRNDTIDSQNSAWNSRSQTAYGQGRSTFVPRWTPVAKGTSLTERNDRCSYDG